MYLICQRFEDVSISVFSIHMDLVISLWISDIYGFLWNYRGSVFLWISIHVGFVIGVDFISLHVDLAR